MYYDTFDIVEPVMYVWVEPTTHYQKYLYVSLNFNKEKPTKYCSKDMPVMSILFITSLNLDLHWKVHLLRKWTKDMEIDLEDVLLHHPIRMCSENM